jgi:hypothetical protein
MRRLDTSYIRHIFVIYTFYTEARYVTYTLYTEATYVSSSVEACDGDGLDADSHSCSSFAVSGEFAQTATTK